MGARLEVGGDESNMWAVMMFEDADFGLCIVQ